MQGVVNRDIKLENTLLDGSKRPLLKICDFGYSKNDKDSVPKSKVGTPGYTGGDHSLQLSLLWPVSLSRSHLTISHKVSTAMMWMLSEARATLALVVLSGKRSLCSAGGHSKQQDVRRQAGGRVEQWGHVVCDAVL